MSPSEALALLKLNKRCQKEGSSWARGSSLALVSKSKGSSVPSLSMATEISSSSSSAACAVSACDRVDPE